MFFKTLPPNSCPANIRLSSVCQLITFILFVLLALPSLGDRKCSRQLRRGGSCFLVRGRTTARSRSTNVMQQHERADAELLTLQTCVATDGELTWNLSPLEEDTPERAQVTGTCSPPRGRDTSVKEAKQRRRLTKRKMLFTSDLQGFRS